MIKPQTLWALFKSCPDAKWLGNLCRALGGQEVQLDFGQEQMLNTIKLDSGWMDERIEEQRERWRNRQAEKRQRDRERDTGDIRDNGDLSQCHACHDTSVRPSVPPSVRPNNNNNTDTEPIPTGKSGRLGVDISKIDPYSMEDGRLFSGEFSTITLYRAALGEGFWWKAINELGEAVCLEELVRFIHEVNAGEAPKNAGAVMTKRLKKIMEGK